MLDTIPTLIPPQEEEKLDGAGNGQRPRLNPQTIVEMAIERIGAEAAPTEGPPPELSAETTGAGATTWTENRTVTAVFVTSHARNAWALFDGLGWKQLSNARDSATTALAILAAHAKQTKTPYVNGREEADKLIHELYVW